MASGPFDQLPALMRLSSESIYRLMHISGSANQWSEETLTEILRGHLSGDHYRIEAPCPVHGHSRCRDWNRSSVRDVAGGIRLTKKRIEEPIWGADILLEVADEPLPEDEEAEPAEQPARSTFFIQAKRIRSLDKWEDRKNGIRKDARFHSASDQMAALAEAEGTHHPARAFYLFYVQADNAHEAVTGTCPVHTTPQDCAAMLVSHAAVVDYLASDDAKVPRKLLTKGTPFRCLAADCLGRSAATSPAQRAAEFISITAPERDSDATGHYPAAPEGPTRRAVPSITLYSSSFERTDLDDEDTSGEVLVIILGKWKRNPDGRPNGSGHRRHGRGWNPQGSPRDLQEAARQWWRLSARRATSVRYLVAVGDGQVQATYSITGATQSADGRFSFDVQETPQELIRPLRTAAELQLTRRKPGARNPVTFARI